MKKKHIIWSTIIVLPIVLVGLVMYVLHAKQNDLVAEILDRVNGDFKGKIAIENTQISPFKNFPYISIDLKGLIIYPSKSNDATAIAEMKDVYIGFDIWTILKGKYDIKTIRLSNAQFNIVQDTSNKYNILEAFEPLVPEPPSTEALHLDLKKVILENVHFQKTRLSDTLGIHIEIDKATTSFKTSPEEILFSIESIFLLNVIEGRDTGFAKNKHVQLSSKFHFNNATHLIDFEPSTLQLEQAQFSMDGTIDFDNDVDLDLKFKGQKPNFDLLIAFAPNELSETLRSYGNKGDIYFDATVRGKAINGHLPAVDASFGCKAGYFNNLNNQRKLYDMSFDASFTNGKKRSVETFEFRLNDFKAKPEAGIFDAKLLVKNFASPEIDMQVTADFDLEFLAQFLNLHDLSDLSGNVELTMNFHDIVDLNQPEKSLARLNQSYASQLRVSNLNFSSNRFGLPIQQLNMRAFSEGNQLTLEECNLKFGNSDFSAKGSLSNLPALLHQSPNMVDVDLGLSSKLIDVEEITKNLIDGKQILAEQVEDLAASFKVKFDASTLQIKEHFPTATIQLISLNGKPKNYPHTIQDIKASIHSTANALTLESIKLKVDQSDIAVSAKVNNASLFLQDNKSGATSFEYSILSNHIEFGDVFTYQGKKYVPEFFYGHELHKLKMYGKIEFVFVENQLLSQYFTIKNLFAKLDRYPHVFHDFNAKLRLYENDLYIDRFDGMLDASDFHITGKLANYKLLVSDKKQGEAKLNFSIQSNQLQLKDLFSYNGKNYVPEEYQAESFSSFATKGYVQMNYVQDSLLTTDLHIDAMQGSFSMHPLKMERFSADLSFKQNQIDIKKIVGLLGENDFAISGHWFTNTTDQSKAKRSNIQFASRNLNMESLLSYEEPQAGATVDHDSGFNLFTVPFPNLDLQLNIGRLQYHKYQLQQLRAQVRLKENHFIYFDQLSMLAASGAIRMTGYLNGSNPQHIYFNPTLNIRGVKLDEVMYKMDNFGQDMLVSDNLRGTFSGLIKGKILLHADLTPKLDESDLEMQVLVEDGRLEKFQPMFALSDFFGDKNLSRIVFDKLENKLVLKNGLLYLPNMVINSSLGFMQLSGKQGLDMQMEYYMRVPLRMVTGAAMQKLFGQKSEEIDPEREDEIIYKDPKRRVSYINIKIAGTPDNYKISLQRNKEQKKKDPNDKIELTAFEDLEEM